MRHHHTRALATDLRPGDELVIVLADDSTKTSGSPGTTSPSALPRQTPADTPADASELMVFRQPQAS